MTTWTLPPFICEHEPGEDDDCVFCAGLMQLLARWPGRCSATLAQAEAVRKGAGLADGVAADTGDLIRGITALFGAGYAPVEVKGWPAAWAALTPGHSATISGVPANAPAGSPIRRWVGAFATGHRIAGFRLDTTARLWIIDPEGPADGSYRGEWCNESDLAAFAKDPARTHSIQSMLVVAPADPSPYIHTVRITGSPGLNAHVAAHQGAPVAVWIPKGTVVTTKQRQVHGEAYMVGLVRRTDWLQVTYAGKTGWVKQGYTALVS